MKFLKKDVSEANSVAGVVDRVALSHPEVSVRFIRDGREELLTPGDGRLLSCIYTVFGKEFTDGLIPIDYTTGRYSCTRVYQQTGIQPCKPYHAALLHQRTVCENPHSDGGARAGV